MSWVEPTTYACPCNLHYRALRVIGVSKTADPTILRRLTEDGPLEGTCPRCGAKAQGHAPWLEIDESARTAVLHVAGDRRGQVLDILRDYLAALERKNDGFEEWLLHPQIRFAERISGQKRDPRDPAHIPVTTVIQTGTGVPTPMAEPWSNQRHAETVADAWIGELNVGSEGVVLEVMLGEAERKLWGQGALRARPIHLENCGYPLVGVRIVVSYLGQMAVIDGIVNPSQTVAQELMGLLANEFRLVLVVRDAERGRVVMRREVAGLGLERNAALCLESARQALIERDDDIPEERAYVVARKALSGRDRKTRLQPSNRGLSPGAFQHLAMPSETLRALDELDAASQRENLRQLLEIDGLPVGEYEAIRKRVLKSAFDQGICAPPRFWRRVVEIGLATSLDEYVSALVRKRSEIQGTEDDDLEAQQSETVWRDVAELVERKHLTLPHEIKASLDGNLARWGSGATATNTAAQADLATKKPEDSAAVLVGANEPSGKHNAARRNGPAFSKTIRETKAMGSPDRVSTLGRPSIATAPVPGLSSTPRPAPAVSSPLAAALPRRNAGSTHSDAGSRKPALASLIEQCQSARGRDGREEVLKQAFVMWDRLTPPELAELVSGLAPLARAAAPRLLFKLGAASSESRIAAALLLGHAKEQSAIAPLCARIFAPSEDAWIEFAKCVTFAGDRAVEELCIAFEDAVELSHDERRSRLAHALCELVLAEYGSDRCRRGVERLSSHLNQNFAFAAARALALVEAAKAQNRPNSGSSGVHAKQTFQEQAHQVLSRHTGNEAAH